MNDSRGRLRLLYVVNFDTGGSVVSLRTLVAGLDRRRFDPVILFYRPNPHVEEFQRLGIEVHVMEDSEAVAPVPSVVTKRASRLKRLRPVRVLNVFLRRELRRARDVRRIALRVRPDLVSHNDNLRAHRGSILGIALTGIPQICHVRSLTEHFAVLDVPLARTVNHFVYISDAVEKHCRAELHLTERRGTRVWDPVEMDPLPDPVAARERMRRHLGFGPEDLVVNNVGRLVPGKGQDQFLEAMQRVVDRFPRARALLVGGPESAAANGDFERRLRDMADREGLRGRVTFTGHRSDVPALIAASDVIVHSARAPEGLGRVLVEALALERPVVATDTGGVGDVVREGRTGYLVPPDSPEELAEAIGHVLARPAEAQASARRGRDYVRSRFDVERHVEAMERLYVRVAG